MLASSDGVKWESMRAFRIFNLVLEHNTFSMGSCCVGVIVVLRDESMANAQCKRQVLKCINGLSMRRYR